MGLSSMVLISSGRCLAFAAGLLGTAALAADADNGKRLAERWCASCHVVAPDQKKRGEFVKAIPWILNKL